MEFKVVLPGYEPPVRITGPITADISSGVSSGVSSDSKTEQNRAEHTHTLETAVSSTSLANTRKILKKVGDEYGKQALEQAKHEGLQVKTPAAFSAHMAKTVIHQEGDLHEKAVALIHTNPDTPTALIARMLTENPAPTTDKLSPQLDSALTGVMGIYWAYGLSESIEACNDHGESADELKRRIYVFDKCQMSNQQAK